MNFWFRICCNAPEVMIHQEERTYLQFIQDSYSEEAEQYSRGARGHSKMISLSAEGRPKEVQENMIG